MRLLGERVSRSPCLCLVLKSGLMTKARKRKKQVKGGAGSQGLPARTDLPIPLRAGLAFLGPLLAGVVVVLLSGGGAYEALLLAAVGLSSWVMGLLWYGLPALGLRGKRPLFAGIGFATVGWLVFLLLRGMLVPIDLESAGQESLRSFIYLALFEGFALQLWTFGLLFRAVADWVGGLTAAILGGMIWGMALFVVSPYAYTVDDVPAAAVIMLIYYILLGLFYGMIRLRTGSLLGTVGVYALQLFTAWVALGPPPPNTAVSQLNWMYSAAALLSLILIWRLWPKEESDYRV